MDHRATQRPESRQKQSLRRSYRSETAGWLLVQVVTQVFPVFEVSVLAQRIIALVIVAGFPITLILAWLFDITSEGIVRTEALPASG